MQLRNIMKALGGLLMVLGILMILVPLTDILYHEPLSKAFLVISLIVVVTGILTSQIKGAPLSTLEALVTAAVGWVIIPAISAIALSYDIRISYLDALFESVSGFTGTGFTVLTPSTLKHSILLW
ncbi:MAG: TrkH family potassium uptake protein, partial [Desulfurococcales archaeon]|nr:TrkH family potassium uptake protein [Desulfurococcales archaeon]